MEKIGSLEFLEGYDEARDHEVYSIDIGSGGRTFKMLSEFAQQSETPISTLVDKVGSIFIGYALNIKQSYYDRHKQEVEEMIKRITTKTQSHFFSISQNNVLTEEIASAIIANQHISMYVDEFGCRIKKEDFSLETLRIIEQASSCIDVQSFVSYSYAYDKNVPFNLNGSYSDDDINALKRLFEVFPQRIVIISGSSISQLRKLLPIIMAERIVIDDKNAYSEKANYSSDLLMGLNYTMLLSDDRIRDSADFNISAPYILKEYGDIVNEYNVYFFYSEEKYTHSNCFIGRNICQGVIHDVETLKLSALEAYIFISVIKANASFKPYADELDSFIESNDKLTILSELIKYSKRYTNSKLFRKMLESEKREELKLDSQYTEEEIVELESLFKIFSIKKVTISGQALPLLRRLLPIIKATKIEIIDEKVFSDEFIYSHITFDKKHYDLSFNSPWYRKNIRFANTLKYFRQEYMDVIESYINVCFFYNSNTSIPAGRLWGTELILNSIADDMRTLDLTPLEAYMFIYAIVILFKEYKEEPIDETAFSSRKSWYTLFNEFIVCEGYSDLGEELIRRYDDSNLKGAIYSCQDGGHARLLVDINDAQYNVVGRYASEITIDCTDLIFSPFDYLLLTKDEIDALDDNVASRRGRKPYDMDCTDIMMCGQQSRHNRSNFYRTDTACQLAWAEAHFATWKLNSSDGTGKLKPFLLSDPPSSGSEHISREQLDAARNGLLQKVFHKAPKIPLFRLRYYWKAIKYFSNYIVSHREKVRRSLIAEYGDKVKQLSYKGPSSTSNNE